MRRLPETAKRLLRDAAGALEDECAAAGEEETREHPELRAHARIAARIRAYLRREAER